jgi:hypothetical protein
MSEGVEMRNISAANKAISMQAVAWHKGAMICVQVAREKMALKTARGFFGGPEFQKGLMRIL